MKNLHYSLLSFFLFLFLFLLFSIQTQTQEQQQQDTPITRFQRYLQINTAHPNPDYSSAISFLKTQAEAPNLNLQVQTLHFTPNKDKPILLLTWLGSNPSLPSLLFNSHLDSVPAEPSKWSHPPFSAVRSSDGHIYARGAQDDKCIATLLDGLLIEFGSQELEDMLLQDEEALTCLRFRSTPLQGDDCTHIEEGEHVLATHKSQFKSRFYDAKVEKVVRVRHSKKIYCRCTFTIKWLHQDLEGEAFTVPSNSIMKLATKSINDHPAVAVFLKSVKQMRSSCASLFPTVLEETDGEMDINKLLEKQIEDISNSAAESKEKMSKDILLEIKVDNKGHIQPNAVSVCEVSISHAQAPHGQNQLNRSTQNSSKLPIDLQVKDQPSTAASIQEDLSENRSHLSPLAARAALASLMSTNHMRIALDGTKMFNSSGLIDMPMKDKVSSEILDASIPVTSASDKVGNPLILTESMSQLVDLSSGIPTKVNKSGKKESELTNSEVTLKCSKRERNVSQPTKAARITRSAVQKVTVMQNEGFQIETCSEEMKLMATTNKRRFTRSTVSEEKKNMVMEVKQVLEEKQSSHNRESCSPEGTLSVPESNVSKKSSVVSKKKKANSSLLDAEINIPDEERNKRQSSCEVKTTQQSEGKDSGNSQGQKRKSTSSKKQEPPRFSPRLRYLPRTRSQGKR